MASGSHGEAWSLMKRTRKLKSTTPVTSKANAESGTCWKFLPA